MRNSGMVERRSMFNAVAAFGGLSTLAVIAPATPGATQESEISAAASPVLRLEDVLAGPNTKLMIERRGQIVLFGINRPYIQNRIDPETFKNWPKHISNMTTIPRYAPRFYLATGRTFQEGSTLKDLSRSQGRASPGSRAPGR
jgi:enoyl-CoA hydratase